MLERSRNSAFARELVDELEGLAGYAVTPRVTAGGIAHDTTAGTLVCTAAAGPTDLDALQERVYQALKDTTHASKGVSRARSWD